ncbi:MAG: hypothetical protein LIP23_09665 [Planctomycetes bacterium]|nr:hypothetical protein [Planctomycetota bacterium]
MEEALEQTSFTIQDGDDETALPNEAADSVAVADPVDPIDWRRAAEIYGRCMFLLAVVAVLGVMSWRPGLLRFSVLLSLANPSQGSLNWQAQTDPEPPLPPTVRLRGPNEWRLGPQYSALNWNSDRPSAKDDMLASQRAVAARWARSSENPWSWQDDVKLKRRTDRLAAMQPPQKSESPYRVGNQTAWPNQNRTHITTGVSPFLDLPPLPSLPGGDNNLADWPALPTAPLTFPPAPVSTAPPLPDETGDAPASNQSAGAAIVSPPATEPEQPAGRAATPTGANNLAMLELPSRLESAATVQAVTGPAGSTSEPVGFTESLRPPPTAPAPATSTPTAPAEPAAPVQTGPVDWLNQEITRPIEGAYLTIYPKLKFVGLCVPGQGYVRKYNQIGVPRDMAAPKLRGDDGRTPYGRYFVATKSVQPGQASLTLSWPSPEDARRIGLDPGSIAQVEQAWESKQLPPQTTSAGGGVELRGYDNPAEFTSGGFALTEAQMLELATALPDGSWVFVQP